MKLRPLFDKIVVRRTEAKNQTEGGILLPDSAKERPKQGVVIAVGPGKQSEDMLMTASMSVSVGETVLFSGYAGNEIELNGEKLLILAESEVLGVIEE